MTTATLPRKTQLGILGVFCVIFCLWLILYGVSRALWARHYYVCLTLWISGFVLLGICPFIAARWKPHLAAFDTTWLPPKRSDIKWVFLLPVVVAAVTVPLILLLKLVGLWNYESVIGITLGRITPITILLSAAIAIVMAPIAEEIFWRGYAQDQFAKVLPAKAALFLQAALFSLYHFRPVGPSVYLLSFGLICGFWRLKKRSLIPVIVVHVLLNAVVCGPEAYEEYVDYHDTIAEIEKLKKADPESSAIITRMLEDPIGHEIMLLKNKPISEGVSETIAYLGHEDEDVRLFTLVMLKVLYGKEAATYYEKALDSDDPEIRSQVISVIGETGCTSLIPRVREVFSQSSDLVEQVYALFTLCQLGDTEYVSGIAENHSSAKVREAARRVLETVVPSKAAAEPEEADE